MRITNRYDRSRHASCVTTYLSTPKVCGSYELGRGMVTIYCPVAGGKNVSLFLTGEEARELSQKLIYYADWIAPQKETKNG